jgi:16S rRNA (adenine1518-N6/adenine1519-N6)-dimethyltransferase
MLHRPRKRFGQNFLQNKAIIDQIVSSLHIQSEDQFIEIGPGLGALTQSLLRVLPKLTAIEVDTNLQLFLQENASNWGQLDLISADALSLNYANFGTNLRIVGNLPYNISTPLILHLLSFVENIQDMHFMLQREVVQRLAGQPETKAYGRLSIITQFFCEVTPLFEVPPDAFYPKPKVFSTVVRLKPHPTTIYPKVEVRALQRLVAQAFSMRRKTIVNNLKSFLSAGELENLDINPQSRPEQISILDYVRITNFCKARL